MAIPFGPIAGAIITTLGGMLAGQIGDKTNEAIQKKQAESQNKKNKKK